MLTITGIALVAGVTMGAGPASAAAPAAAGSSAAAAAQQQAPGRDRDRVVGYYRSSRACYQAGRIGEFRDRWDDYRCVPIRGGFHRSRWALVVSYDDNGHDGGHNGGGHDGGHNGGGHDDGGHGPWK